MAATQAGGGKALGVWRSWAVSAGTMIGSGIFLLPAVLAPYGSNSLWGWLLAGAGALAIGLCLAGLAARQPMLGGAYGWVRAEFGPLPGFLTAWGYWVSIWVALAAVAIGFAGYLVGLVPALHGVPGAEPLVALAALWAVAGINLRGVRVSGVVGLVLTVLRILPLLAVGVLGILAGSPGELPAGNPHNQAPLPLFAGLAMVVMWAFAGVEAATVPAEDTADAARTIPRAVLLAVLGAGSVYVVATLGVLALLPQDLVASSSAPFADAARVLGGDVAALAASVGALVAMAGGLNANMLLGGQMPRAAARDGLCPGWLAARATNGAPVAALLLTTALASAVILANYSRTLVAAYTTMILLSTLMLLLFYLGAVAVTLRQVWRERAAGGAWAWRRLAGALAAGLASLFFLGGSGLMELLAGAVLLLLGVLAYHLQTRQPQASTP